jgi:hypothetical protein
MPDATITSTASTFGTISGVFSADQSTISGTISGIVPGTLTGSVGVPGPAGPAGIGLPAGGTSGQFLQKTSGVDYATDWVTVNLTGLATESWVTAGFYPLTGNPSAFLTASALTPYLTSATAASTYQTLAGMSDYLAKAGNLAGLANTGTARTNLGLGSMAVVNDAPSDGSQYARKNGAWDVVTTTPDYITSVSSPLSVTSGNLTIDLSAYAPLASPAFTGNPTAPTATFGDNDTSLATTAFVQSALAGGTAVARDLEVEVRNQSGSTIAAGSIVYISGATGNKPLITLAQANNDANSAQTIGFVKTAIANNGTGYVIVRGELENIDTSALTEGVQLYLSPTTAGTWTTTKPSAPQHLVYVGIVIRSHPTLGTILVAVQNGYELDELHDVAIGTLANNNLLAYESSTDLWKNKTYSALGLLTSADAASTYYPLTGNPSSFLVAADIAGKAPLASPALTGNVTITSNSTSAALFIEQAGTGNILTLHDQASDTTFVAIDQNGKVGTIPSTTANAGFNVPHGAAPTTPVNGDIWTTTTGLFMRQNGVNKQYVDFDTSQTINGNKTFSNANQTLGNSTAAGTIAIGSGATISGSTKTINIGSGGVTGSTTAINIGSAAGGTSTTNLNGTTNFVGPITGAINNITLGNGTAASTYNLFTGATVSGSTKTVAIGTGGLTGSTTNISIGSAAGGASTTTLNGTTNGVTAAADTNSVALATTAYVVGQAGSATPIVDGTAAVGTSLRYARQDHVHPTDTTRAPLASPGLTGTPTAPTATAGTNTTQIATTAFVTAAVPALATLTDSRQLNNDTKAMSPNDVLWAMMTQDYIDINRSGFLYTTAGTPQYNDVGAVTQRARLNATVASSVIGRVFGGSQVDQTSPFLFRNNWASNINFNLKTYLSGRAGSFALLTDSTFNQAFWFGKIEGDALGALTRRGFGWAWSGGTGSRFVNLVVHNGTTLTTVASSFAVTQEVAFDWDLYSDGAGNVTLYINGSQVATSSAGPTSYQSAGTYAWWREEAYTTAAPTFANHTSYFTRGRAMILNY